jgi:hypothetical protein
MAPSTFGGHRNIAWPVGLKLGTAFLSTLLGLSVVALPNPSKFGNRNRMIIKENSKMKHFLVSFAMTHKSVTYVRQN